jgi:ABC-type antimicrobial peptide transport system permease subunit
MQLALRKEMLYGMRDTARHLVCSEYRMSLLDAEALVVLDVGLQKSSYTVMAEVGSMLEDDFQMRMAQWLMETTGPDLVE